MYLYKFFDHYSSLTFIKIFIIKIKKKSIFLYNKVIIRLFALNHESSIKHKKIQSFIQKLVLAFDFKTLTRFDFS